MTRFAGFVAVVSCMFVLVSPTVARDIYVAKTGSNSNTGTSSSPYLTIAYAISKAVSNDIIHVKAGTYNETYVTLKSNLTLVSEDGVYAAKLSSYNGGSSRGFVIVGSGSAISNVEINGFESYSTCGGGTAGDGLLRIYNSDNIRIKNCLIHDAPLDCDVVKIGGFNTTTSNTLIENCVIYNPAPAVAGGHAQCLDAHPVNGLTVRGCWIYHTPDHPADILIRANGGSSNVLWENNVFGPSYDDGRGSPATSAGTVDSDTPQVPSVDGMTVRNNLFLSCQGEGAFRVDTSRNVKFYNNLIWNYLGTGAAVSFRNDPTKNPPGTSGTQGLDFCNNIVCNTNGKPAFVALGTYTPGTFTHDYNLYWQVAAGGYTDVTLEPHSLFVDPQLSAPSAPVLASDTWSTIVPRFNVLATSPVINEGFNEGSSVPADINGTARPQSTAYDIGPYESPNRPPVVDAGADVPAVYENCPVSLHATASDPDGDTLSYSWTQTAGKAPVNPTGASTADYAFTTPVLTARVDGTMTFKVTVSDGKGGSASDSVTVNVFMAGDINHDWYVNVGDLQLLVSSWGRTIGEAGYNPCADLNGDNYVNVGDLQLLVANWGRSL